MTTRKLPARSSLEQLRKQAKSLLRRATAHDEDALRRFATLPMLAGATTATLRAQTFALHDAQSVIAREHGFTSWNALREEVDARSLSFSDAVDEFVRCATAGAQGRADRLLALHPDIASATLQTALVLADEAGVETRLRNQPELATAPGGTQRWEPLLYVCQTCMTGGSTDRAEALVAIARRLIQLGANPNAEYHWNWHPELPRTALWAAICSARNLSLAEVLLEAGANPTDGVSGHIAGGGGNLAALELLHRFGFNVNGIPGGVPPLVYMMQWATDAAGPRWLIDHGADPDLSWGAEGEAPLHAAARRWDVPMVEVLVRAGADVQRRRTDGSTPHTVAELHGNREVAAWLLAHGANDELTPLERFIAACARGARETATAMLAARPKLGGQLGPEHHLMLHRPAESGDAVALETMLACGFDPATPDKDGVTALHRAAMAGHVQAVRVLLAHGAPVNALDGMFAGTPLIWAVEGRSHAGAGADHVGVAQLLIAAGSSLEWAAPDGAPGIERTQEGLIEIQRDAARREGPSAFTSGQAPTPPS